MKGNNAQRTIKYTEPMTFNKSGSFNLLAFEEVNVGDKLEYQFSKDQNGNRMIMSCILPNCDGVVAEAIKLEGGERYGNGAVLYKIKLEK